MTDQPPEAQTVTPSEQIKAGTVRNLHDLYLWDVAEKQRILRGATAEGYGLDAAIYARPFPGTPPPAQTAIVALEQRTRTQMGGAVLAAALAATGIGGGVGGMLAAQLLGRPPTVVTPAAPAPTASMVPVEYDVIFESNGKKIEVVQP